MRIFHAPRFGISYQKLLRSVQEKAEQKEIIFRANPFDSRLDTHKLHGKLKNQWSFSVDGRHRVLFEFFAKGEIIFLDIGDHQIYN